jgi:hypothetical protein
VEPAKRVQVLPPLVLVLGILLTGVATAALTVYSDRDAWEADLTCPHFVEDLESEVLGTYWTPYETAGGLLLTTSPVPTEFGIYADSPWNATQYIRYRNFCDRTICDGLMITFPDAALQTGFGFDYHVSDDTWEVRVADQTIVIQPHTIGFVGVIDDAGSLPDFTLYCGEYVQNGIGFDNIGYSPDCTSPVDESTWGTIKALYR